LDPEALIEAAEDADIVIVRAPLPVALFARATRLRAAIRHGAGVDMIPLDAATAAGVLVANVPGVNARSVGEFVIFAMLALARRFRSVDSDLRSQGWDAARAHALESTELNGKTVGLIGMGHVGREVWRLAWAFDMTVIAYKPSTDGVPCGVSLAPLDDVIQRADFLVLCCPLTDATRGMMNRSRLGLMKRSAFLINAARGAIAAEADLLKALEDGVIAGAALDVFAAQPLAREHPLFQHQNVILTPHLAGITDESMERMGIGVAKEALRVLSGALPENLINPSAIAAYRQRFA
jgi:D-3-phosphoglycerate dehydrogenase